jgi:phosphoribosylformylglycinamidine synthase
MSLPEQDHSLVVAELGREPTPAESALFENLWSEHCAYRSSRPLLSAFDSEDEQVVVGPGDDAAVVRVPDHGESSPGDTDSPEHGADATATDDSLSDTYLTFGIESHNHPSYVDPFDGAATGVGGIVRDTLSMGAYPIALLDSLYFGDFDDEHARYLFEGVVEGISHYGNCIGVPTVGGSVAFHDDYEGNPLVNVACVGLLSPDRLVTAEAQQAGNKLVLVGNATGRDGLGGASFASEDLAEDAETEDRPAVQVGDPYTEKLLIEANERLIDEGLIQSARDLGAAGLGGASAELVAKGGFGAEIDLDRVHQREPEMNALEILLAESQERMCYEVRSEDVDRVAAIAERFDLGCSVIGEVTEGNYVCTFAGGAEADREVVVDVPAEFLGDGAPMNDLESVAPEQRARDYPAPDALGLAEALRSVIADPSTASKRWVYRQYDHEVGTRTSVLPGDDAALLALRETEREGGVGTGLALSAGADPNWTTVAPYEGARAVALENATNLAVKGARPLAAVDCLNGGNPEKPEVYGGFRGIVDGLAEMCRTLSVPVVGGNVSLYNDSVAGPIPPTPTLAMLGTKAGYEAPPAVLSGEGELLLVGGMEEGALDTDDADASDADASTDDSPHALGGSVYLSQVGGSDQFPTLPADPAPFVGVLAEVADAESTLATHDVSHGGLAVTLAEMVGDAGASVSVADERDLFSEAPGRAVIETTDPEAVREAFAGVAPVRSLGTADASGALTIRVGEPDVELSVESEEVTDLRATITDALD